jgi:hypothetical protein
VRLLVVMAGGCNSGSGSNSDRDPFFIVSIGLIRIKKICIVKPRQARNILSGKVENLHAQ